MASSLAIRTEAEYLRVLSELCRSELSSNKPKQAFEKLKEQVGYMAIYTIGALLPEIYDVHSKVIDKLLDKGRSNYLCEISDFEESHTPTHFAHFRTIGEHVIDVFAETSAVVARRIQKEDYSKVEFDAGCCGQSRCLVCVGIMSSVSLVEVRKGRFPFKLDPGLGREVVNKLFDRDNRA
jgi:hypothetical protein